MLKQFLFVIVSSALALFFVKEVAWALHLIYDSYHYLVKFVLSFFGSDRNLALIVKVLALTVTPFLVAMIPNLIYKLIKNSYMPNYYLVVWVIWVILATIIVLI